MTGLARTVLGDVDPSGWGVTLVHEHLIVDWGELQGKPKLRFGFEDGVSAIAARLDGRSGRRRRRAGGVHADRDRAVRRRDDRGVAAFRCRDRRCHRVLPRRLDADAPDRAGPGRIRR